MFITINNNQDQLYNAMFISHFKKDVENLEIHYFLQNGTKISEKFEDESSLNSKFDLVTNIKFGGASGGGSSAGLSNIYSEEETVVGTWIDGKPLYRKVVKYTLETPKFYPSYPNFDTGIRNIDYIMLDAQVSNGDNNLQYFRTKKAFHGYLEKATGYYHFVFAKSGDPLNAEAGLYVFVFHYTKTTD